MLKLKDFLGLLSATDMIRCFDSTGELICLETVEQLRQKPVRNCPVLRYKEDANCYTMWLDTAVSRSAKHRGGYSVRHQN